MCLRHFVKYNLLHVARVALERKHSWKQQQLDIIKINFLGKLERVTRPCPGLELLLQYHIIFTSTLHHWITGPALENSALSYLQATLLLALLCSAFCPNSILTSSDLQGHFWGHPTRGLEGCLGGDHFHSFLPYESSFTQKRPKALFDHTLGALQKAAGKFGPSGSNGVAAYKGWTLDKQASKQTDVHKDCLHWFPTFFDFPLSKFDKTNFWSLFYNNHSYSYLVFGQYTHSFTFALIFHQFTSTGEGNRTIIGGLLHRQ